MSDIRTILTSLGLLESEVKTYLAALGLGPSTVIALSKATKLSRQAIYDALSALVEHGIMSSVLKGKKRHYLAEHPDTLLAYAKKRKSDLGVQVKNLKRLVPKLTLQMGGDRPVVRMLEGKEGAKLLSEMLEHQKRGTHMYEVSDLEAVNEVFTEEELMLYRNASKKKGLTYDAILRGEPKTNNKDGNKKYIIPEDKVESFNTNISIGEREINMVALSGKMYTIQIENKEIRDAMKLLFELAVKGLKKQKHS